MLKGKTVIELTNVKTGQVERFEDENIVTNAVQYHLNAVLTLMTSNYYMPLYKNTLGGIKLFESSIEEDVNNYMIPSVGQNKVIGYASTEVKTNSDSRRGNLNLQETTMLENGVQLVWDFATSEANGIINCVCLTSVGGGKNCYSPRPYFVNGSSGYGNSLSSYYGTIIGQDYENDCFYMVKGDNLLKCKYDPSKIKKLNQLFLEPEIIEDYGAIILEGTGKISSYVKNLGLLNSNTLYYASTPYSATLPTTVKYFTIATGANTQSIVVNANGEGIYTDSYERGIIVDGYWYLKQKNNDKLYKVDLSNPSNVQLLDFTDAKLSVNIRQLPNGDILSGTAIIDPSSGTFDKIFDQNSQISASSSALLFSKGYVHINTLENGVNDMMLMTINNLQQPVTKTADKTMKITYTLLESESA